MSLPNILTFLRILVVPFFVTAFLYGEYQAAMWMFLGAALTDVLDGFIARFRGQQTRLGTLLDPLADKLFLLSTFSALCYAAAVPLWALVVVLSKEIVVVGGWMLRNFLTHRSTASPSILGKSATAAQVIAVGILLLDKLLPMPGAVGPVVLAVAMLVTGLAGLDYLYRGLKELERRTTPG